jgi:hypothetical protein
MTTRAIDLIINGYYAFHIIAQNFLFFLSLTFIFIFVWLFQTKDNKLLLWYALAVDNTEHAHQSGIPYLTVTIIVKTLTKWRRAFSASIT